MQSLDMPKCAFVCLRASYSCFSLTGPRAREAKGAALPKPATSTAHEERKTVLHRGWSSEAWTSNATEKLGFVEKMSKECIYDPSDDDDDEPAAQHEETEDMAMEHSQGGQVTSRRSRPRRATPKDADSVASLRQRAASAGGRGVLIMNVQRSGAPGVWNLDHHTKEMRWNNSQWDAVDIWMVQEISMNRHQDVYNCKNTMNDGIRSTVRELSKHMVTPTGGTELCLNRAIRYLSKHPTGVLVFPGGWWGIPCAFGPIATGQGT